MGVATPAILTLTSVAAVTGDPYDHMDGWGAGAWIWMTIVMVVVWGSIIGAAIWAVSRFTGGENKRTSPLDIARERLAKGEISEEEFERIRHKL
jgi:putative membrane protein